MERSKFFDTEEDLLEKRVFKNTDADELNI